MAEKFKYTDYQLESWDYVVLVVYFVSILLVGIWVCSKKFRENDFTESKYLKIIFFLPKKVNKEEKMVRKKRR